VTVLVMRSLLIQFYLAVMLLCCSVQLVSEYGYNYWLFHGFLWYTGEYFTEIFFDLVIYKISFITKQAFDSRMRRPLCGFAVMSQVAQAQCLWLL
jgi:hypothetical protein